MLVVVYGSVRLFIPSHSSRCVLEKLPPLGACHGIRKAGEHLRNTGKAVGHFVKTTILNSAPPKKTHKTPHK